MMTCRRLLLLLLLVSLLQGWFLLPCREMQAERAIPKCVIHTFFFPKIFCRAAQNLSHFIICPAAIAIHHLCVAPGALVASKEQRYGAGDKRRDHRHAA